MDVKSRVAVKTSTRLSNSRFQFTVGTIAPADTRITQFTRPFLPDNPAEHGVLVVQMLARLVRDEELRPRRVGSRVGHAQHAALVVRHAGFELVLDLAAPVALATASRPRRIAPLSSAARAKK